MGYCFNKKELRILIFKFGPCDEVLHLIFKSDGGSETNKFIE